jgi:DNA-binding LacI/PurR family transcriptional regulator
MVTLADVASKAGVTAATVSNVLRQRQNVSQVTAARVLQAVAELGYRPNLAARALAERRSGSILLLLPDRPVRSYQHLLLSIERASRQAGYSLIVRSADDRDYALLGSDLFIDGVIVVDPNDKELFLNIRASNAPVVVLDSENTLPSTDISVVSVETNSAGYLAARHLLELGHKHFGLIGLSARPSFSEHVKQSFINQTEEAGARVAVVNIEAAHPSMFEAHAKCTDLILRNPTITAIFATCELIGIGALEALKRSKTQVPQDISIIAFADDANFPLGKISMTRVRADLDRAGAISTAMLMNLISKASTGRTTCLRKNVGPFLSSDTTTGVAPSNA